LEIKKINTEKKDEIIDLISNYIVLNKKKIIKYLFFVEKGRG